MLELEGCDELDEAEVRRIVAAELGARSANIAGLNVTQITVKCAGTRVAIFVSDPLSRKSVQRSFDIGLSDPRARGRLVSIAATELVLASWVELETNRKLHVEPIGPAPAPDATIAAREIAKQLLAERYEPKARTWYDVETPHDRMLRFVPLVSTRKFFTHPGTLIGGGLRMGEERFRFLSWSADALFESGTVSQLGNYYDISTGTLGGMVLAYVGSRTVTARLGAGLRVGFANIAAAVGPSSGGALVPWGWPLAATSVTLRFTRYFGVDLGGEGGYVSLPGSSGGQPLFSGFWFSGQAGLTLIVPGPPPNRAPEGEVGE
ncbi:MAG TPA: hypothetical protein VF395_21830 [Polyangiaceae bacterium]